MSTQRSRKPADGAGVKAAPSVVVPETPDTLPADAAATYVDDAPYASEGYDEAAAAAEAFAEEAAAEAAMAEAVAEDAEEAAAEEAEDAEELAEAAAETEAGYEADELAAEETEETVYAESASTDYDDWDSEETESAEDDEESSVDRTAVNRMKKIILIGLVVLFLIPLIICLILVIKMHNMQKEMDQLRKDILSRKDQIRQEQLAKKEEAPSAEDREAYQLLEKQKSNLNPVLMKSGNKEEKNAGDASEDTTGETTEAPIEEVDPSTVEEGKKIYLTFDDGPSPNTDRLLDVLEEKKVKATFFMVLSDRCDQTVIRRMASEGHTLGIHSASHVYSDIYASLGAFKEDIQTVHDLLQEMTGVDVKYYRFPGGSSNRVSDVPIEDCIAYLEEEGYTYFDWNASNGDSSGSGYTPDQLTENVLRYVYNNTGASVVLMHDLEGAPETIEALPGLIDRLRAEGYVFLPIDETTLPVHHRKTVKEQEAELAVEQARLEKSRKEKEEREKERLKREEQSDEGDEYSEDSDEE